MTSESTVGGLIEALIDYRGKTPAKTDSGVPLITAKVIKAGVILDDPREYIAEEAYDSWMRRGLPASGDILITTEAPLGEVARVGSESRIALAQRVILLRPDAKRVDPSFLFHYLRSPRAQAALGSRSSGTTVSGIRQPELKAVEVHLLSRPAQEAVGAFLDAIDDLIENNRRRVEALGEMARAIYREWFVRFRYPAHESVPLVDSALGPIPEGWTVEAFDTVASFENGFAFKPSHWGSVGRPIIKIKELKAGITSDTPRCPEDAVDAKYSVEIGDLLMSWSADLGVYLWADEPGLLNQHLFQVRPVSRSVTVFYLLHALDNAMPAFRARAQGTTMKHIKRSALHEVTTLVPSSTLLARFHESVEPIHRESTTLQRQARDLAALRDLLLPKLVTGRIDVSGLNLDALVEEGSA